MWILVGAAALGSAAYLTRYAGVSILVTGVVALLILNGRNWRKKFSDTFLLIVVSCIPILLYYLRNFYLTGIATNRILLIHPPNRSQLLQGLNTISAWIAPGLLPSYLKIAILGGLILFIAIVLASWLVRRSRHPNINSVDNERVRFISILLLFEVVYLILLLVSLTFFDASTRLNDRILSPIYLTGIIFVFVLIWNGLTIEGQKAGKILVTLVIVIFISFNLWQSADLLKEMRVVGKGFTGREWVNSETIALVRQLPSGTLLFSNEAFPINFLTGRLVNWIPENYDPVKGEENPLYLERLKEMKFDILESRGALVLFDSIEETNVYASLDQLTSGLVLWKDAEDGAIFVSP
jgi:hypothetical protein